MKIKAVIKEKKYIYINTEYITLDNALKLAGIVSTGGQAKMLIQDELIYVNNEICSMRGKKLKPGDTFKFEKNIYEVKSK